MSRRRTLFVAIAGSIALLLLFITFVLPGIVRTKAVAEITKATGRQAAIERVAINPFTLRARVDGFRLAETDGKATFVSFSSLSVRLSTASVVRRALVVGDITLTRPQVSLVRVADNRYNFTDIVDRIRKQPKSEGETHFSLNNIRIEGGSLDFDDRAARTPAQHTVRALSLAIPFISNIPYMADRYVTPHFAAIINDAPLRLEGKLKPLEKSAETILSLKLDRLNLPHYLAYVPFEPGFAMPSGTLSTNLDLTYRVGTKENPELDIAGSLQLDNLTFTERGGAPLAVLKHAKANIKRLGVFGKNGDLGQIALAGLDVHLRRDRQGIWNVQRLLPAESNKPPTKDPAREDKKTAAALPKLTLAGFTLSNSTLHFSDAHPAESFATTLQQIRLEVKNFSTAANHLTPWDLGFGTDGKENLVATGTFGVAPGQGNAQLKLTGVRLQRYYPYLADLLTAPVSGVADFKGTMSFSAENGFRLSDSSLDIADLLVKYGPRDQLRLKSLAANGINVNTKERQAKIDTIAMQRGDLAVTREADGTISLRRLLKTTTTKPVPAADAVPGKPFTYTVQNITINGVDTTFTDQSRPTPPTFTLKGITARLKNFTGPKFAPMPFTLAAGFGSGKATVAANGTIVPDPFSLKGQITVAGIPLRDFDAYYPDDLGIFIAGGLIDAKINLDLARKGDKIAGSYGGSLGVRSFYSLDTEESEDLLKWESLQLDNVRGTLEPFSVAIKDIALTSPFARVIVNKDGTLNLQHLGKPKAAGGATPPATAAASTATAPTPASSGPAPVAIDTITIQDGTLAFIDRKLRGGFASTFFNLGGKVSGLSSEANRFAAVDLRGVLQNQSPLKIGGTINPLRGDLYLDLTASFTDIELSPVTPYSGTYLGYTIDKGKLFLDLKYKIDNKALSAENKVFIDQFTFGRAVESDKATNLPVRLAVALLKDSKGEIHLDLPVSGRTDDPQFSTWKVILQMLKNLLVKAASSPFSLLSSMLGGTEDFSAVTFAPGTAALSATEQDKLTKLAKALKERPGLSLEITGYADRERDAEGYRQEQLRHKIRTEKFLALVKAKQNKTADTAETMAVTPEDYPLYLKTVYRKEEFPKPRNAIGLLKDLPDAEMKKLLLTHLPAGEKELQGLAHERAAAVQLFLRDQAAFPHERLFLKQGDPFKIPEKKEQSASRVEFGVLVK